MMLLSHTAEAAVPPGSKYWNKAGLSVEHQQPKLNADFPITKLPNYEMGLARHQLCCPACGFDDGIH